MGTKVCSKCGKEKPLSEFYKSQQQYVDGCHCWCKECMRQYSIKYFKEHKQEKKEYSQKRQEKIRDYQRIYQTEYSKKQRKNNPQLRLNNSISAGISQSINNKSGRHWENLVGYTIKQLKQRLKANFKKGMTWDNYGEWHIDHKKPKSLFNYTNSDKQAFKDCWALANLQPLWAEENIRKHNSF